MFQTRTNRLILVGVSIIVILGIVTALFVTGTIPIGPNCFGVTGTNRTFTIIANQTGFNNSQTRVGYGIWPIMNASRCDNITFKVTNTETTESHGFAVGSYHQEIIIGPGQTISFSFVAVRSGQFRVYCIVLCIPHDYMQNGQLNIT